MISTDPVQALIDAGAIPVSPFGPTSRYSGVPLGLHYADPNSTGVPYVLRRFIPQQRDIVVAGQHIVRSGDRPDLLAAQTFGDPELYWRIADANSVTDPFELTDTQGERIIIPVPPGI